MPGEKGYIESQVVNSARKRALEIEKKKKELVQAEVIKDLEEMKVSDEKKTKEQSARDMERF